MGQIGSYNSPLQVNTDNTVTVNGNEVHTEVIETAPASATAVGVAGTVVIAADAIYVCTATNTWVKAVLATWV